MRKYLSSVMGVLLFLVGLGAAQSVLAITTTLTFDDIPSATDITNQYVGIGVTVSGATALAPPSSPWAANSGLNIAYAPTGGIVFFLNPAITGFVQSGSVYISSGNTISLYAYDFGGALVGWASTPADVDNFLVSFTSSGNPIEVIVIHDGGGTFGIDTLTLVSAATVPEPATAWLLGLGLLGLIGPARRKAISSIANQLPRLDGATRSGWNRWGANTEFCGSLQATHQPKIAYFHRGGQCT